MHRAILAGLLGVTAAAVLTAPAFAWSSEGYAIIAAIAEARLTPATAQAVAELLRPDGAQHLDQIGSWASSMRSSHPETVTWHFVDIPLAAQRYNAVRDCPGGNCVVEQIPRWSTLLGNANLPPVDRLIALKYVVSLVADVHQPLHCESNFASHPAPVGDRGGNDVHLVYFGHSTNLHALWDGGILEKALNVQSELNDSPNLTAARGEAARLTQSVTAADIAD